ncbi:helix-turn-helix domain-containing protein [Actinomadura sp. LOL_016]|uniref:helix-turn-helix domain-containing protein n=1 Tax=unclassified Actinomadura TaxID=2626254 RepID=UPI003A80BBAD
MGDNSAREFFGAELRRRRDEAKLTAKELGDTLGCTAQWVSTMESGRKISEQSAHDLEWIENRMERQSILTRPNPPRTWLVLDEVALRRGIGGPRVMHQQLETLIAASERYNTMVQVIPNGMGYHAGLGGDFTILGFDDGPDTAYTESAGEGLLIDRPARVKDKVVRWGLLRGEALRVEESRALIRTVMENL